MEQNFMVFGEPQTSSFKVVTGLPEDAVIITHEGLQQLNDMKLYLALHKVLDERDDYSNV